MDKAEQGNADAQYLVGRLYLDGPVLIPDSVEALYWFDLAARQDHTAAQYEMGKLLASVALTIPDEYEPITGTFWPWRASKVEKHVHNTPFAHFYIEAWDYYVNGVFQYTRYRIVTL